MSPLVASAVQGMPGECPALHGFTPSGTLRKGGEHDSLNSLGCAAGATGLTGVTGLTGLTGVHLQWPQYATR